MLRWFSVAPQAVLNFEILAQGTLHHDEEDPCDPTTTTYALRASANTYAEAIAASMTDAHHSVEEILAEWVKNVFEPPTHCHHDWDCCGCRTGHMEVKHVVGALFIAQTHTARNY